MLRSRRIKAQPTFVRAHDELYGLTRSFCEADTASTRMRRATALFGSIWGSSRERAFVVRLLRWIRLMEQDRELSGCFAAGWDEMVAGMDSVTLFAEAGLPGHHALPAELMSRVFQRLLPSAREESDTGRLFAEIFSSPTAVERFTGQQRFVFERLMRILWPRDGAARAHVEEDLRQAMCLLATRVAGRGASAAVRQRGSTKHAEDSPFYRLIFSTEDLMRSTGAAERLEAMSQWRDAVRRCVDELNQIHLHMEDAGVSAALVYDLRSIEGSLLRMEMLAAVRSGGQEPAGKPLRDAGAGEYAGARQAGGYAAEVLLGQSVNLLARKTVERTGHGGEHYIAHSREAYWGCGVPRRAAGC